MNYVDIPGSTLRVANICLGSTSIGSAIDRANAFRLLDVYWERGGNFLDTAKVYADWLPGERSVSEKTIGRWLRERGLRDRIVLATKGAHPNLATMTTGRLDRRAIEGDLSASLRHLQTDVIDLYWLHRDDVTRPVEEIMDTLLRLVQAGKIRYFGCSNWQADRIGAAQAYAQAGGKTGFVGDQMQWSLAHVEQASLPDPTCIAMNDALWRYHRATGLAAFAYSSQANGWFTRMANGAAEQMPAHRRAMYATPINRARCERAQQLAAQTGISLSHVVLGYLLAQPFPTVPIVGCRTVDQLEDSLAATDVRLSAEQVAFLQG